MTLKIWSTEAISDDIITHTSIPPTDSGAGAEVSGRGCRDEYLSWSICVNSTDPLTDFIVNSSVTGIGTIPEVTLRYVKPWWRSGYLTHNEIYYGRPNDPMLINELLVYDPQFVVADETGGNTFPTNYVDADTLQPFDLPADYTQQYWATVYIPSGCTSGTYDIALTMSGGGVELHNENMSLEVLDTTLPQPDMTYGIWDVSRIDPTGIGSLEATWKTEEQYAYEIQNLRQHGIKHPFLFEFALSKDPNTQLSEAITIRREQNNLTEPLLWTTLSANRYGLDDSNTGITFNMWTEESARLAALGITDFYGASKDEATAEQLSGQLVTWDMLHNNGWKFYTAVSNRYEEAYNIVGNIPDIIMTHTDIRDTNTGLYHYIQLWSDGGTPVWYYQPTASHGPNPYRYRFGLQIRQAGFSGGSLYAYQETRGTSMWSDFDQYAEDGDTFREHCFTYPTYSKPIDTTKFEGFREGVQDVRYAVHIESAGGNAPYITQYTDMYDNRDTMLDTVVELMPYLQDPDPSEPPDTSPTPSVESTWGRTTIKLLRGMLNDIDEEIYTSSYLYTVIMHAAFIVNTEIPHSNTYIIDMIEETIEPDPVDVLDNDFVYLTVLKAACIIDTNNYKATLPMADIMAKLGPSTLHTHRRSHGYQNILLIESQWCALYTTAKDNILKGRGNACKSILSPFVGNNFDPKNL